MANQKELDETYMNTAVLHSFLSKATRAKVGAILVTKQGVTLSGFNGTATGRSNACEEEKVQPFPNKPMMVTKKEVIHAENNAILKAAREGVSCIDATMYITLSPCLHCSAMMVQAGIKRVVYLENYRDDSGIKLLKESNIIIQKYSNP
jgi:dCMP deaminase